MIQFNLLPAIKMEYIKARRIKRLVTTVSISLAGFALVVLVLMYSEVNVLQKRQLSNFNKSIQTNSQKLQAVPDLDKILTVQNQLSSLTQLHDQNPAASRLFTYLSQVTPANVSIAKLDVDFEANTMEIDGNADALSTVNKFVDTLKFTTFTNATKTDGTAKAFSGVVLTNFGKTTNAASYSIALTFDPDIFSNSSDAKLTVPKLITSRSETEKPAALFQNGGASQ